MANKIDGQRIKCVRLLKRSELKREGWEAQATVVALELEDGTLLYASRDEEGNAPGAMFAQDKKATFMLDHRTVN